uniref:Ubiquitin carboxyl-terminal hydrolase n=1 Tax=Prymnesium polylepis TaxID=72548 RepID=A0A7S4I880_9EUKA
MEARATSQPKPPPELFFCQQHDGIGNACGTIACMHAVSNAAAGGAFELSDGPLKRFMEATNEGGPADRGRALLQATELQEMSDATAAAGETEGAGSDDAQGQHFIAFVNFGGQLYELDGRNFSRDAEGAEAWPVFHGLTSPESFLLDAAKVVQEDFMARDPESVNFNLVALSKCDE